MKKKTTTRSSSSRGRVASSKSRTAPVLRREKRRGKPQEKPREEPSPALDLARTIKAILEEKQGRDAVILDVRGISSVTDFYVLVSGMNHPHIKALFDDVDSRMKHTGRQCYRKVGMAESGWLVLDYVDVVIHILLEENRKYYAIEDLWAGARTVK